MEDWGRKGIKVKFCDVYGNISAVAKCFNRVNLKISY